MTKAALYICLFATALLCTFSACAQGWMWAKGSTGSAFDAWPVATDSKGGVFIAGVNFGLAPVTLGSITVPYIGTTGYQVILAKYDSLGNVIWAKGTQNGDADLIGIATDKKGNAYLLGRMYGTPSARTLQVGTFTLTNAYTAGEAQYFLAKFDPSGNVLWAVNGGNTQNMVANLAGVCPVLGLGGIAVDDEGSVYVTTNFKKPTVSVGTYTLTNTDLSGTTEDILIAKYNTQGTLVWAKSAGGAKNDDAYGITVTPAGDIYIAGVFASPSLTLGSSTLTCTGANAAAFIARFDKAGNPLWGAGTTGEGHEYAIGLAADEHSNVYLTGGLVDNAISLAGTSIPNPAPGKPALYLAKFSPSNTISWYKTAYSISSKGQTGAWGYSIAMSPCGVIWVSGSIVDSLDIDGHVLEPAVPYNGKTSDTGADPIFMAGYTANGTYVTATSIMAGADDQNGIACDSRGNVYMCADYVGKVGCSIGSSALPRAQADELSYLARYTSLNPATFKVASSSTTLCSSPDLLLHAPTGYSNYLWDDGATAASRLAPETGLFTVTSVDSCVSYAYDTFRVQACDCNNYLFVPNTFTPNGDGENDIFYPRCGKGITLVSSFKVFNRWGVLVFQRDNLNPNDKTNGWDGTYNGQQPGTEVFVWTVDVVCQDGGTVSKKGSVTIIR